MDVLLLDMQSTSATSAVTHIRPNLSPLVDTTSTSIDTIDDPSSHLLLAELSFEAGHERWFTMNAETPTGNHVRRQQGVLWKRRDVFKNRWRPRWFVLHPDQGVLTYYLLSNTNNNTNANTNDAAATTPQNFNRRRTFSESSTVSQNPMDYDVVPRGTIYLLGSCTVQINRELTRASDELFCFTIASNSNGTNSNENKCHLAAPTAASRARWIRTIQQVCENNNNNNNNSVIPHPLSSSPQTTPTRTNRSLVFAEEQRPDPPSLQEDNTNATTTTTTTAPPTTEARPDATRVTPTPTSWKTIPSPLLFQNVPSPLEQHMEDLIAKYLPLLDPVNHNGWTPLFDRDGVVASTRIMMDNKTNHNQQQQQQLVLQSSSVVPHPPPQILNLLLDTSRRKDWEHNVRHDEQLLQYNPHTRLDYSAYHPVWPTSARDFAVCVQWRLVDLTNLTCSRADENETASAQQQQQPPAILLVTCSVPQADLLKPPQPNHVRAHLEVSLQLLQPIIDNNNNNNKSCRHTRILSYDLCGNIPKHLTNHIMMQQANLPRVVDLYLQRIEPTVPTHLNLMSSGSSLTNDDIIQTIVRNTTGKRSLQIDDHQDSIVVSDEEEQPPIQSVKEMAPPPSLLCIAIVLMGPIIVYNKFHLFGKEWIFIISAWYAIRWVVLAQIGKPLLLSKGTAASSSSNPSMVVTCRFTVDLKGVLRFISNKQEERQEERIQGADHHGSEISVTHIVMSALAQSLVKYPAFNRTHIKYPLLLVDGYVSNGDSVQMGIPYPPGGLVSVQVEHKTVQEIANALAQAEHALTEARKEPMSLLSQLLLFLSSQWQSITTTTTTTATPIPQFVVMATPDSDHCQVDIDAGNLPGVTVAVVVSGIRLVQKKPTLSMSLTIQSPLAVETCREFAEHVQKLVQFPEMCDE